MAAEDSPRPPRAPRRRGGAWLAGGLAAALLAGLAGTAAWVWQTEAGWRWLYARVPGLDVVQPQGRPVSGAFSARELRWTSPGGARLVVRDLAWRELSWHWRPHAGAWLGVRLDAPRAASVEWQSGPAAPEAERPRSAPPEDLRLPLELVVAGLAVERLQLDALPPLSGLGADLHLGADEGRVHRLGRLVLAWPGGSVRASAEAATDAGRAISARADAAAAEGAVRPWQATLAVAGTLPRLQLAATLTGAGGAALAADATLAPFAPWPLAALQARADALDLSALAAGWPATAISGRAVVDSQGSDVPIRADLELRNALPGGWDAARLPLAALNARVEGSLAERSRVDARVDATLAGSRPAGRLRGEARWRATTLQADLALDALRPEQLDARLPAMTLSGPLKLALSGLPSPEPGAAAPRGGFGVTLDTALAGRLAGPRPQPVTVEAAAAFEQPADGRLRATVSRLALAAGATTADATLAAERDAQSRWRVRSDGRLARFDPSLWWPGAPGSGWRRGPHALDGRWNADLALPQPAPGQALRETAAALAGSAEAELRGRLAGVPLQARATLKSEAAGAARLGATLAAERNRAAIELSLGRRDSARVELDAPAPGALAPLAALAPGLSAWWPSQGSASLRARAEGRWPDLRTDGEAHLAGLASPALTLGRADLRWYASTADRGSPLELRLRAEALARGAQRLDRLDATLAGTLGAHRLDLSAAAPLRPPAWAESDPDAAAGGTTLSLRGDGGWTPGRDGAGRWSGRIAELVAGSPGAAPWVQARGLALGAELAAGGVVRRARVEPGRLELLGAGLAWTEASWEAAPRAGAAPRMRLLAALEPLAVAPWLARLQPDAGWRGDLTIGGRFDVRSAERFDADLVVERRDGDLVVDSGRLPLAFGLTGLRLALAAHDGVWQATQALVGSQLGVVAGAQTLRTAADAAWPAADAPVDGVVEMRIADLDVWSAWLPAGWRVGGSLFTTARVSGSLGTPQLGGRIEGQALALGNLLQGLDLREGSLLLTLDGEDARLRQLRFAGGDGSLSATGSARFGEQPSAELTLVAERFEALTRVDRQVAVSGRATVGLRDSALAVDGRFSVDRGRIDISQAEAPTLDEDVVVVNRPLLPGQKAARAPAAGREPTPLMRRSRVDLQVALGDDLRLQGRGIDTRLAGQLRISTPEGRLAVNGIVRAVDGRYTAYGQNLFVERGIIRFAGEVATPTLDVLAVRQDLDVRVGVTIQGSTADPRIRLYSEPEMSEMDKLSWLVTGRASEGLGRADTAILQQAALALLAGEKGGQQPGFVQRLGLDELSFGQTGEGAARDTVVTVGKQLSDRLFVGYERGLQAATGSWQLIYRVARRFTVRASTGDESAFDVIWTWRWGPPEPQPPGARRVRGSAASAGSGGAPAAPRPLSGS